METYAAAGRHSRRRIMSRRIGTLVAGLIAAALIVAPVSASSGKVSIRLDVNFDTGVEQFTASGAFCPSGHGVSDAYPTGGGALVFHVHRTFVCDADGGSLTIDLAATTSALFDGTSGGWTVVGGTGPYAGAHGGGQIIGVNSDTGIVDTYSGTITR
jgi:hypothetical protein